MLEPIERILVCVSWQQRWDRVRDFRSQNTGKQNFHHDLFLVLTGAAGTAIGGTLSVGSSASSYPPAPDPEFGAAIVLIGLAVMIVGIWASVADFRKGTYRSDESSLDVIYETAEWSDEIKRAVISAAQERDIPLVWIGDQLRLDRQWEAIVDRTYDRISDPD